MDGMDENTGSCTAENKNKEIGRGEIFTHHMYVTVRDVTVG